MVAAPTVLANLVGARVEIRDKDAGVITDLSADHVASGKRICPARGARLASPRSIQRASKFEWSEGVRPEPMSVDPTCSGPPIGDRKLHFRLLFAARGGV